MDSTFVQVPEPHVADYVVIAIFLCICIGIGLYYGHQTSQNPTLENYFFGNRHLLIVPVSMSLFVTFLSAIAIMGFPAEIYMYGIEIIYYVIGHLFSMSLSNITIVPMLYPLKLTSTYEYLQLRFDSKAVRTLGMMIGMLQTIIYMGVTLYAPGLALQTVAGLPLWVSITVIGLVCTLYTTIGGIKSVVWTDVFQCVMMFIGLLVVIIKGSMSMGEHDSVLAIATEGRRLKFLNFDLDPRVRHTGWGLIIGGTFSTLGNWCNQSSVQRIGSLRSLRSAKIAFWVMVPIVVGFNIIFGYLGLLVYSYYNAMECDPVLGGFIHSYNQVIPYFVLDVLRSLPGFSGIFISCLFSGALSTFSSGINALSANTVEDILGDFLKKSKLVSQTFVAKLFVLAYGVTVIGLAFGIDSMPGSVIQMAVVVIGTCGGPLGGLYFLGGLVPKANWIGAITGSVSGLVFNTWIAVGAQLYGTRPVKLTPNPTIGCFTRNITVTTDELLMYTYNSTMTTTPYDIDGHSTILPDISITSNTSFFLYNVSYTWYGLIGFFLTLLIGTLVSVCTGGDRGKPVEARFVFPIIRKLCGLTTYDVAETEDRNMLPVRAESHVDTTSTRSEHLRTSIYSKSNENDYYTESVL